MSPDASGLGAGEPGASALLLDLYLLTMAQSYFDEGMHERPATFSLYTRRLPDGWGYYVAAGLEDVLDYLERLAFEQSDLAYLEQTRLFTADFLAHLGKLRFTGGVRAMPEGTVFFPEEPVLEVTATLLEAQLVETRVLQEIHFQSLVAAKAARNVDVAAGRTLVDFGLRRTHRADAGMRVARSSYLAGFAATSNVLAGEAYGIPVAGTMAHAFVQAFDDELEAFRAYARSFPDRSILLLDTYDTVEGARRAAVVARELARDGHGLAGVRLDSGDLAALSHQVRAVLDEAGCESVTIFASGGLDERDIAVLLGAGVPIDGFGIGAKLGTVADSPSTDMAYKLASYDGRPTVKLSPGKANLPGPKQVWRLTDGGAFALDVIGLAGEDEPEGGEPLLLPVMRHGTRVWQGSLEAARKRCAAQRSALPERHRLLDAEPYDVERSRALAELADRAAAEARRRHGLASGPAASLP
jgi:nicotinate phosphoribosyltransferase